LSKSQGVETACYEINPKTTRKKLVHSSEKNKGDSRRRKGRKTGGPKVKTVQRDVRLKKENTNYMW